MRWPRIPFVRAELRKTEQVGSPSLAVTISELRDGSANSQDSNRTILDRTEGVIDFNLRGEVDVRDAAYANQIRLTVIDARDRYRSVPANHSMLSFASLTRRVAVFRSWARDPVGPVLSTS